MDPILYYQKLSAALSVTAKLKVRNAVPAFAEKAKTLETTDRIAAAATAALRMSFPMATAAQLNVLSFYLVGLVIAAGGLSVSADEIKSNLDSMSEMGEMESLRLQMAMDRLSKMMSTLSNILKKISDTSSQITQNLK